VTNCSLEFNDTASYEQDGTTGGAIDNDGSGKLTLVNCTIADNHAKTSGGIANAGALTIVNCTIWHNRAEDGNREGGGLANTGSVTIANTIIANNDVATGGYFDVSGAFSSQGGNMIVNPTGSSGWVSTDLISGNPLLAPLGDYGGPQLPGGGSTLTMPPLPGSPVINNGNNAAITNPPFPGPPVTDQRGVTRIIDGKVDIGAVESQGFIIKVSSGDNQAATVGKAFATPLVVSVSSAYGEPVAGGYVYFSQSGSGAGCTFPPAGDYSFVKIDNTGRAITRAVANATAGSYTVDATSLTGNFGASATFHLTNTAGAPYRLAVGTQPSRAATAARPFSRQPVIFVVDRYGNLVTSDNTTRVTASLRAGPGPLMGTTTVTASGGIATFTKLGDHSAGRIVLKFKSVGLANALANRVLVKRAPLARLDRLRGGCGVPWA
jgi:hypothetical protein